MIKASGKDPSSETRKQILNAARKVFTKHGYAGARMQKIADEARINKALLHYHFRNKETLFEHIFIEALQTIQPALLDVLNSEVPFFDKIRMFCQEYIEMLQANAFIIGFVVMEVNRNPLRLVGHIKKAGLKAPAIMVRQINHEIEKGNINDINPNQLIINIISLSVFPFLGRPILKGILKIEESEFDALIEERKKMIPEWVIRSIAKN